MATFEEREVKEAIWEYGSQKSLDPDRINFKFVKTVWETWKCNILRFLNEFHSYGILPRGRNASSPFA